MVTIKCNNSPRKEVRFIRNGGETASIIVQALHDGEFWFTVGHKPFATSETAKRAAVKIMRTLGYTFDKEEMNNLTI